MTTSIIHQRNIIERDYDMKIKISQNGYGLYKNAWIKSIQNLIMLIYELSYKYLKEIN